LLTCQWKAQSEVCRSDNEALTETAMCAQTYLPNFK